jgi:predicted dinucleotide-binding enzyme
VSSQASPKEPATAAGAGRLDWRPRPGYPHIVEVAHRTQERPPRRGTMKIGIVGSGIVGQVLANGFIKHGHEVMIGTNHADKRAELEEKTRGRARIGSFAETGAFGEVVVLAAKGTAAEEAVKSVGIAALKDKTVIDATNPIADAPPTNGVLRFFTTLDDSLMERLQRLAPEANFVKAFNSIGNAVMVDPDFGGVKPTMFIAGNSDAAKAEVKGILAQFGWEWEDLGRAEAARAIEPLCILWCIPGFLGNSWSHAFKLLKK